jgi:glycosyltransferase involved in cell wall biosynthesis
MGPLETAATRGTVLAPLSIMVRNASRGCLRVAVLSLEADTSASWYVRILSPMAVLRQRIELLLGADREGANVSVDLDVIDRADLVLIQRLFPARATWPVIESVIQSGKRIVYEAEDFLLDPDRTDPDYLRSRLCRPYISDLMRAADAVIVPTAALREAYSAYSDSIHVIPYLINDSLWGRPVREPTGAVGVGFLGRPNDEGNLALIEDAVLAVHGRLRERIRLVLIGCCTPKLAAISGVQVLPEPVDYPARAKALREAGIDLALAPMRETTFNRCKGGLCWLEYSACGAAGIYTDLAGIREAVTNGSTGLLVGPSPEEWSKAIENLVLDQHQRVSLARAAQEDVFSRYTIAAGAARLAETLELVARPPAWPRQAGA